MTKAERHNVFPDSMTLGEVRAFLRENIDIGVECACCTQRVQRYSRPITSAMAAGLILVAFYVKASGTEWTHIELFLKNKQSLPPSIRGDYSKLRFWNLIEVHPEKEGFYRVTPKGHDFVAGTVKVNRSVLLFNNKMYGFKGNLISITDALKNKFDYDKLLKGVL